MIANRQSFYISPQQSSGKLSVQVSVRNGRKGSPLLVENAQSVEPGQSTITLFDLLALGAVIEIAPAAAPEQQREEILANSIQLWGVALPERVEIAAGNLLPVTLYWHVQNAVVQDYTVFVHVLDQSGHLVAQLDRPPGGGTSPTSSWKEGQTLQDTYPVPLPAELSPGDYTVHIGIYTWPDLQRQRVTLQGKEIGDSIEIGTFSVVDTGN